MARRLLSHLLITLAVLCLVSTYFVWVIDATLFNPSKLTDELRKSGVSSEIATVLVDKSVQNMPAEEREITKAKVAQVITPKYIEKKLKEASGALVTFMKNGSPQPSLDLTDFPGQVRAAGVDLSDDEAATFDKPIEFNAEEQLNWLPRAYIMLSNVKYAGIALFIVLITAEWFVSPVGQKLNRIGRVFLHTSVWFFTLWLTLIFIPAQLSPQAKDAVNDDALNLLVDNVLRTISSIFSVQFLGFAIVTGAIAATLYTLRRARRHIEKINDVPTARIKSRKQVQLPK